MIFYTQRFDDLDLATREPEKFEIITVSPNGTVWKTWCTFSTKEESIRMQAILGDTSQWLKIQKLLLKEQIAYLKELDNYY